MVMLGLEARDLFQSCIPPAQPDPKLAEATGKISPLLQCLASDPKHLCCHWVPVQIRVMSQAENSSTVFSRFTSAMLL